MKKFSFVGSHKDLEPSRPRLSVDQEDTSSESSSKLKSTAIHIDNVPSENKEFLSAPVGPSRSHSVKKIVRRMTDKLKRAKSFHTTVEESEPPEPEELAPCMLLYFCCY